MTEQGKRTRKDRRVNWKVGCVWCCKVALLGYRMLMILKAGVGIGKYCVQGSEGYPRIGGLLDIDLHVNMERKL